jgi:hypothetical protein
MITTTVKRVGIYSTLLTLRSSIALEYVKIILTMLKDPSDEKSKTA